MVYTRHLGGFSVAAGVFPGPCQFLLDYIYRLAYLSNMNNYINRSGACAAFRQRGGGRSRG